MENITVEEREIICEKENVKLLNQRSYTRGKYLISDEWCLGGTSRSYDSDWNNVYNSIESEIAPKFVELFDYLSQICPKLSFFDYRYIEENFVDIVTYDDHDYYSTTTNSYYRCDLEELEKYLREKYQI